MTNATLDDARAKQAALSRDKRAYVRSLLTGDPQLDDRTLGQLVQNKFGSGLARRNMDEVRRELGWTWKHEHGKRSRVLVRLDSANTNTEAPVAAPAPAPEQRGNRAPLSADEQREVALIDELRALMQRQGYESIMIPREGVVAIKLVVTKRPGEHVEALAAHH